MARTQNYLNLKIIFLFKNMHILKKRKLNGRVSAHKATFFSKCIFRNVIAHFLNLSKFEAEAFRIFFSQFWKCPFLCVYIVQTIMFFSCKIGIFLLPCNKVQYFLIYLTIFLISNELIFRVISEVISEIIFFLN